MTARAEIGTKKEILCFKLCSLPVPVRVECKHNLLGSGIFNNRYVNHVFGLPLPSAFNQTDSESFGKGAG